MLLDFRHYIIKLSPAFSLGVGMVSRASGQIVALLITLVAARYLTPTDFGVYAIAAAIVTMIRTLLYGPTFQYVMQTPELNLYSSECLFVGLALTGICSVIPLLILLWHPTLFGSPSVLALFLWMAPCNFVSAFSSWTEAQVLRNGRMSYYYAVMASTEIMGGIVGTILFSCGWGVMSFVPMLYVKTVATLVAYIAVCRPVVSDRFSGTRFLEIANWSAPQFVSSFTGLFSNYGADFIIGALLSPAATGLYRAASRITGAVSDLAAQPVRMIAITSFAKRKASGGDARDLWPSMMALSLFIALPALGGLAALADLVLPHLFGPAWAHLAALTTILGIGRVLASAGGVATPFLVAHGKHKSLLPVQIISSLCLLIGLFALAKHCVRATALVTATSTAIGGAIYVAMAYRAAHSSPMMSAKLIVFASAPGIASTSLAITIPQVLTTSNPLFSASITVIVAAFGWCCTVALVRGRLQPILHPITASDARPSLKTP